MALYFQSETVLDLGDEHDSFFRGNGTGQRLSSSHVHYVYATPKGKVNNSRKSHPTVGFALSARKSPWAIDFLM